MSRLVTVRAEIEFKIAVKPSDKEPAGEAALEHIKKHYPGVPMEGRYINNSARLTGESVYVEDRRGLNG